MRRRSFRGVLLTTISIIVIGAHGAHILGLPPELEFLTPLPEPWAASGLVVVQPDLGPERPLAPHSAQRARAQVPAPSSTTPASRPKILPSRGK